MSAKLYAATAQHLITKVTDTSTRDVLSGATITVTLYKKPALTEIADAELDHKAMAETSTPGTYSCDISSAFNPAQHGPRYSLIYNIAKGGNSVLVQQSAEVLRLVVSA